MQKNCSIMQEREVARKLNGKVVAGSGCGGFDSGDVDSGRFLVECKTVTKPQTSFSVKHEWLVKIKEQAFESGKDYSCLAFRFSPESLDYVVVDINTFSEMKEAYERFLSEEEDIYGK